MPKPKPLDPDRWGMVFEPILDKEWEHMPIAQRYKRLLKRAKRDCGLRCVRFLRVEEVCCTANGDE